MKRLRTIPNTSGVSSLQAGLCRQTDVRRSPAAPVFHPMCECALGRSNSEHHRGHNSRGDKLSYIL
jgi:hypothetical protein